MVLADGTVALVGAPAEFPPPTGVVRSLSPRLERRAGVGDGVFVGAAGVVTVACCWPGVAAPLAGGRPGGVENVPGGVAVVALRGAREVGLGSMAVRGPSTRLRGPVSGGGLVAALARSAEVRFG